MGSSASSWTVCPARRLAGTVHLPGDKSISHRALMLSALSPGEQVFDGLSGGADVASTATALRAMGAPIDALADGGVRVGALPAGGLREPGQVVDCGNSGTTMRLLAGLAAGQSFETVLTGDASLLRRPMARILEPLRGMGARATGHEGGALAPLTIRGGGLRGIVHRSAVASAQVKSCLLLAGLFAQGRMEVHEPALSRDHSERMLRAAGVLLQELEDGVAMDCGQVVRLPEGRFRVPCDLSASAFFVVAAAILDGAEVVLPELGTNPTRLGYLDLLGGYRFCDLTEELGEERGTLVLGPEVAENRQQPLSIGGATIPRLIDEIPVLAILAARSAGVTRITDAGELRAKESDRIETTAEMIRNFGVEVEVLDDGLVIEGRPNRPLRGGCTIDSHGDHRIAMAAAVGALAADAPVQVTGVEAVETSFPGFLETLESCVER
ncbi:MAG: 3-phosphoshikimate 1-carboxyvinyltransferase [Myxococcota bacterium]|nr:3-phosphoshikimate 1-carboxyvinyltransferase [Myxococcota bacterium]